MSAETYILQTFCDRYTAEQLHTAFNAAIRDNSLDADKLPKEAFEPASDAAEQIGWLCDEYGLTCRDHDGRPIIEPTDVDVPTSEGAMEQQIAELFEDAFEGSLADVRAFADTDLMTRDKGVVVRFRNGCEFQITIQRSRRPARD